jgi:beta-lactamase class A
MLIASGLVALLLPLSASAAQAARPDARPEARRGLEERIERLVKDFRRRGLIRADERTAWSVYDFASDEKLASINEDEPLQAASLIKPFLALAYMDAVRDGDVRYTPLARGRMTEMIQRSDHTAANWVMRRLGGPAAVQRRQRARYAGIRPETRVVEYIPAGGRTYRNLASAHDYSRFLHALWRDDLPGADEIRRLMSLPGPDRLKSGADSVPKDTLVYDKTGSTSHLCGDMGILVARSADGRKFPYIVVGVIEKSGPARDYFRWMRRRGDVIRAVSSEVYEAVASRHGLDADVASSAD